VPMSVHEKVVEIIARQAGVEPAEVRPDAVLQDLGVDSLGLVEAIFAIEETFDIQVPFNANDPGADGFDVTSVASVVAAVQALIDRQTEPSLR
jgi:acyl carrier protein